jgi:hypothetical protein
MASFYYGHSFPRVFVGNNNGGTIDLETTAGVKTSTLTAGEIGVFDKYTQKSIDLSADDTFTAALANNKQFYFAMGSYHTVDSLTSDNLTDMYGGLQESVKSAGGIKASNVTSVTKVVAKDPLQEKWTIGWDGATTCAPSTECDSVYTIRVEAKGDFILKRHNRNVYREYSVQTECCEGCETCTNGTVDPLAVFQDLADQINNDPEMNGYAQATVITDSLPLHDETYISWTFTTSGAVTAQDLVDEVAETAITTANFTDEGGGTSWSAIATVSAYNTLSASTDIDGTGETTSTEALTNVNRKITATIPKDGEAGSTILTDLTDYIDNVISRTDLPLRRVVSEDDGAAFIEIIQTSSNTITFDGEKLSATPEYNDTLLYPFVGDSYVDDPNFVTDDLIVNVEFKEEDPCGTITAYSGSVGLLIEGSFVETKFGNCSFHPTDHYNLDGIRFEISLKDDAELCAHDSWRVVKRQSFKQATGTGEGVLRKLILANGYRTSNERFEFDPRWREAENMDAILFDVVDRTAKYDCITINYFIPWGQKLNGNDRSK